MNPVTSSDLGSLVESFVQRIAVHAAALRDVELLQWVGRHRGQHRPDGVTDTQWQDTVWDESAIPEQVEIRTTRHWGHASPAMFETAKAPDAARGTN
ncbi:MAG: hypothetical protein U1D29_06970 [Burkholderiales bacterium]|nr:hypothetical protein [Burkholderiales bacterium]MDZ4357460.1 hypothetical protein [Variovorax sp.]